jgi:hypothetical protein
MSEDIQAVVHASLLLGLDPWEIYLCSLPFRSERSDHFSDIPQYFSTLARKARQAED